MEFYIINHTDVPAQTHVVQVVNQKKEVEYLDSKLRNWHKGQPPMRLNEHSTRVELFGFKIEHVGKNVLFTKINKSTALYKDGVPRRWQGVEKFTLVAKSIT